MNMAVAIYVGTVRPLACRLDNWIENTNEMLIAVASFHLMFFTDWMASEELKFSCGWSMIFVMASLLSFNLVFVIKFGIRQLHLLSVRVRFVYRFPIITKLKMTPSLGRVLE
mmetsp:Transcript_27116/g.41268  ORF Transcript_27116/g.41268 Transcript_27116/m.41268 type:complete len:112 (-) Transcript_27116:783-1118(-)